MIVWRRRCEQGLALFLALPNMSVSLRVSSLQSMICTLPPMTFVQSSKSMRRILDFPLGQDSEVITSETRTSGNDVVLLLAWYEVSPVREIIFCEFEFKFRLCVPDFSEL